MVCSLSLDHGLSSQYFAYLLTNLQFLAPILSTCTICWDNDFHFGISSSLLCPNRFSGICKSSNKQKGGVSFHWKKKAVDRQTVLWTLFYSEGQSPWEICLGLRESRKGTCSQPQSWLLLIAGNVALHSLLPSSWGIPCVSVSFLFLLRTLTLNFGPTLNPGWFHLNILKEFHLQRP